MNENEKEEGRERKIMMVTCSDVSSCVIRDIRRYQRKESDRPCGPILTWIIESQNYI